MFLLPSPKRWHFRVMPPHPVTFVLDCRLGNSLGTFCFVLSFSCSKLRAFSVWEAERTGPWVEIKLAPFSLCPNLISISAGSLRWQLSCQPGLLRSRASYPGITNPPATFHYLSALGGFFPLPTLEERIRLTAEETNLSLAKLFIFLAHLSLHFGHCCPGLHGHLNEDPAPVGRLRCFNTHDSITQGLANEQWEEVAG